MSTEVRNHNNDVRNHRRSFYVRGKRVEVWVNPQASLRLDLDGLCEYAAKAQWVTMFNALVLMEAEYEIQAC
jgi:hypothetical protein